jgi:hypothetical protein
MLPEQVMAESPEKTRVLEGGPVNRKAVVVIVALLIVLEALAFLLAARTYEDVL